MFLDYYKEKCGENLKMSYKTYFHYFKTKKLFSFSKPKTDKCDCCAECELRLESNPADIYKVPFEIQKENFNDEKRSEMIT